MLIKKQKTTFVIFLTLLISLVATAKDETTKPTINEGWSAFSQIQLGNKRFSEGNTSERNKLVNAEQPPVIVLSCSDSRVPPEKVFDQSMGQIYTVRTVGHVLNSDGIASIEYAVENLKAKVLVVMGHDSCSAVKSAMTTPEGKAGSPHLESLLSKIRPSVSKYRSVASTDKNLEAPVRSHVTATLKDLLGRSKIVREAVEDEKLLVAQGVYHLASGRVDFWSVGQPIVVVDKTSERLPASKPKKIEEVKKEEPKEVKAEVKAETKAADKKEEAPVEDKKANKEVDLMKMVYEQSKAEQKK